MSEASARQDAIVASMVWTGCRRFCPSPFSLLVTLDLMSRGYWLWDGHRPLGLAALVIVLLAAPVASLYKILHLRYELWKGMHMANYVAFPLALLHLFLQPVDRGVYGAWIALAVVYVLMILHRIHGIYVMRKNPFIVVGVIKENRDTWTLQFAGRPLKYLRDSSCMFNSAGATGCLHPTPSP